MSKIRLLVLADDNSCCQRTADRLAASGSVEVVACSDEGRDALLKACLLDVDAILVGRIPMSDMSAYMYRASEVRPPDDSAPDAVKHVPVPPVFVADGEGTGGPGPERYATPAAYREAGPGPKLTRMEQEVLRLIAQGKKNSSIADGLFISVNTVKTHIQSIFRKLRIENRSQAVRYALLAGMSEKAADDEPRKWRAVAEPAIDSDVPGDGKKGGQDPKR